VNVEALVRQLGRYLRGECRTLTVVRVPAALVQFGSRANRLSEYSTAYKAVEYSLIIRRVIL